MEYLIIFFITIWGVFQSQQCSRNYGWYLFSIQPIIILAALRSENIGTDTGLYVFPEFYEACRNNNLLNYLERYFANGYLLVNWCVSRVTDNVHIYLYVIHSIMYGSILYALYRLRDRLPVWIGVFILCFVFYRESLNIARQFTALGFDILAFSFLIEKKWLKAIIYTYLGYEFHHSALIFTCVIGLFYLIERFPKILNRLVIKIIFVAGTIAILVSFSIVLDFVYGFGVMDDRYLGYGDDSKFDTNLPISQLTLYSINLISFYIIRKETTSKYSIFFEYMMLFMFILCFAGLISTYTIRIMAYFSYMTIIIFSILYYKNNHKFMRFFHFTFFIIYWFLTVTVANLSNTYPYKFDF